MTSIEYDFGGKTVFVTGASRGIGAAVATAFASAGATVVAIARDASALRAMAGEHPRVLPWVIDVLDPAFGSQLAERDVDILVNNAGTNRPMPIEQVPADVLDHMLDLNVRSAFLAAQAAVRSMLRRQSGGSIVNITSQMGHVGGPRRTVYCMTKHALEGLTKAMAVELAPSGIRVNSVAPTFVETPMTQPMLADPGFRDHVDRMIPLGRLARTDDVAAAVLFLASPHAGMITGTSLRVDGGWTAH